MRPALRSLTFLTVLVAGCTSNHGSAVPDFGFPLPAELSAREFGTLVDGLSEPAGYFQSDNLVSNETSYLHVMGALETLGVNGGAYLGVGPDQNYSYIAEIKPDIAFMIDIRRDAVLQHLLYKALFELSRNRLEYLCLLTGAPIPRDVQRFDEATVAELIAYIDAQTIDTEGFQRTAERVRALVQTYGVALSAADLSQIRRIHVAFVDWGLEVRYNARASNTELGRPVSSGSGRGGFNTVVWRDLLTQTDLAGVQRNYLASRTAFHYLKEMHRRNRIVPVVGDLGGSHALAAIGREIERRGLRVSAFYVSNVEQYLMQGPGFNRFAQTVVAFPFDERSVIIRSYLRGGHPQNIYGHRATQILEKIGAFAETIRNGGYSNYQDLVTRNAIRFLD